MARLTRLRVRNYRSIGTPVEVSFPENMPLVLLGQNNTGKSNIVRAMELLLGGFWPGNHEPDEHEHFHRDRDVPVEIRAWFAMDDLFGRGYSEIAWAYDRGADDPSSFRGRYPSGGSGAVSNADRDTCFCIVLEADRNLRYQLGYASKWTYLSRLMHRFHKALAEHESSRARLEDLFRQIKAAFQEVPQFAGFVGELRGQLADLVATMTHRLEVDFEAYNPVNFFQALRLQAAEGDEPRALEEMGTGEQQVLAMAFAYAYAKAFHGGIVLVIEEPEAHLHPLAQQWLARRLAKMATDGLQIVITTHSPSYVDILGLEGLALVTKTDEGTRVTQVSRQDVAKQCIALGVPATKATVDNILPFYAVNASPELLAGFFARVVVLVEGPTEAFALPIYFEKCGLPVAKEGVAVIPVHGKGNLGKWRRLFMTYGIPSYVVFDNDVEDDVSGNKRKDA